MSSVFAAPRPQSRPQPRPLVPAAASRSLQFLTLLLGAVLITYLDYVTGPNQEFGFFYNVIIILACVQFGMWGLVFVPICFAGHLMNAMIFHGTGDYSFRPTNAFVRAWSFIAVGLVSSLLNRARQSSEDKQHALEASASEREAVFRCLPDAVLLLDQELRVRDLGGRSDELLGLQRLQARGARLADLPVDPVLKECFRQFTAEPGLDSKGHMAVSTPLGVRRLVAVSAPIQTERQPFKGWVLALRDVTDLVRSQELRLSRARSLAVQETRTQLARHLHDNVAQTLAALRMRLDLLAAGLDDPEEREKMVRTVQRALGQAIRDLRQTMWELRPTALDRLPFAQALEAHLGEVEDNTGTKVALDVAGPVHLAPDQEVLLFYLIQEAVANSVKYSQSDSVDVGLREEAGRLLVEVRDTGAGFDLKAVETDPQRKSYGLQDMKDRARVMGADLEIRTAPGQGTRLRVSVPVETQQEEQAHG